ncbi:MAG: anaerobic ribonucleoside-triphosphate reductase activating protein [Pseudohongiellaceae bacterium]
MRVTHEDVVFQEVPGEVALAFTIAGCPLRCPGCHSSDSWAPDEGWLLSPAILTQRIQRYSGLLTAVVFLGGEWHPDPLSDCLQRARSLGLVTCLYTGMEDISADLKKHLDYLKVGPWRRDLGGLDSPSTNQRFIDLHSGRILNHMFQGELHAQTDA